MCREPLDQVDDKTFMDWFRVKSEDDWFGSSKFGESERAPNDKTRFLTRKDCEAADGVGIKHISDDCEFECKDCNQTHYRYKCSRWEEGWCRPCVDLDCMKDFWREGCGQMNEGICKKCPSCPWGL